MMENIRKRRKILWGKLAEDELIWGQDFMEYILKKVVVDLGWIFWRENLRRNKYLKRKNSMQGKLFTSEKISRCK